MGLPFFVLSTNSPLMQAWFTRRHPGRSPYWLYAISNIGSILGLLSYLALFELTLSLHFTGICLDRGLHYFRDPGRELCHTEHLNGLPCLSQAIRHPSYRTCKKQVKGHRILWILLSACASLMLLAVTNQITQEVAAIPFLWVLPLIIYLLSFVLTFSGKSWYHRRLFTLLFMAGTAGWFIININASPDFILEIILYNFLLFAASMICHGELYALRPTASQLTRFYLMVSIGGAIGGLFVNLAAPFLFRGFWELHLGMAFIWVLLSVFSYQRSKTQPGPAYGLLLVSRSRLLPPLSTSYPCFIYPFLKRSVRRRNFYGLVHVKKKEVEETA